MTDRDAGYREGIDAELLEALAMVINPNADWDKPYRDSEHPATLRHESEMASRREAARRLAGRILSSGLVAPSTPDDGKAEAVAWAEKYLEECSEVPCTKFCWDKPERTEATVEIIPLYTHSSPASDGAIREALTKLVVEMRDKHSTPTGDAYSCGAWDQSQRILGKLAALSAHAGDAAKGSGGGVEGHAAVPPEIPTQRSGESRDPLGDGSVKVGPHREDAAGIKPGPPDTHAEVKNG